MRARPPGIRSSWVEPVDAADDDRAGAPPGPHPGRRDDRARAARAGRRSRSATIARRSPGVGDRAERRRGSGRGRARTGRRPGRRRTSTRASATAGAGATAHAPPVATIRSAGGRSTQSGVASASRPSAARAAAIRSVDAVAGRVGPRRDAQLAQPIAQPMPVGAPGRPRPTRSTTASSGSAGREGRRRDDRRGRAGPGRHRRSGEAAARVPAS